MFIISQLQDTIAVQPRDHHGLDEAGRRDTGRAIEMEINKKYVNKVFPELGFCVCLWSLLDTSEGVVTYGDGCLYHKVSFQLVIFKPVPDDVLTGKVLRQNEEGLQVTLGFFESLYVSIDEMPRPAGFEPESKRLYWVPNAEGDEAAAMDTDARLYIEVDDLIRVRVKSERFDYATAPAAKAAPKESYRIEVCRPLSAQPIWVSSSAHSVPSVIPAWVCWNGGELETEQVTLYA